MLAAGSKRFSVHVDLNHRDQRRELHAHSLPAKRRVETEDLGSRDIYGLQLRIAPHDEFLHQLVFTTTTEGESANPLDPKPLAASNLDAVENRPLESADGNNVALPQ